MVAFESEHQKRIFSYPKCVFGPHIHETSIPVLNLYYDLTKIQPVTETSLNFYYDLTKIQPPPSRGAENHERVVDREQTCEDAPRASATRGRMAGSEARKCILEPPKCIFGPQIENLLQELGLSLRFRT